MKKLTEECCGCDEGIRLLQFICWEHSGWSRVALAELLWQMAYAYCHELRRHSDALAAILLLEDSWQQHRIHNAIKVSVYSFNGREHFFSCFGSLHKRIATNYRARLLVLYICIV